MSFLSTLRSWEYLAKKDPLWAILSDPSKKGGRWQLDEFFASGQDEVDRTLTYLQKQQLLPQDFETAVDFGCGVGRLSRALAGRFERVFAVDASATMVEQARTLNSDRPNLEIVLNQEPRLARFADNSISFVYTTLVLQHISYPESLRYVEEFLRILKPGGIAMFQTPTLDRTPLPWRMARGALRRIVRATHLPVHAFYIDMNTIPTGEIEAAVARYGCKIAARFNTNRNEIGPGGELVTYPRRFERMVSERFVVSKQS